MIIKSEFYFNRGLAYDGLKQVENAINDYSICIKYTPDYVRAFNNRAVAYYNARQIKAPLRMQL
jgi:tetratricopeptide (TPR) repeat protein